MFLKHLHLGINLSSKCKAVGVDYDTKNSSKQIFSCSCVFTVNTSSVYFGPKPILGHTIPQRELHGFMEGEKVE